MFHHIQHFMAIYFFKTTETTLKYFDIENRTTGFKEAFLYFKQMEQFSPFHQLNQKVHCLQFRMF